jgi:ADP-heptose:LPS heptosyltransferase
VENILIIRLKAIGDVVLTLPAVNAIRENFPNAKITFLTSKENAVLLRGFPEVDEIITLDRATLRSGNPLKVVPEFFGLLKKLRSGKFSHVVDFQGYGETAWLTRLTNAPQRWGVIYSTGRKWAYTHAITRDDKMQFVDFYRSLLEQCGLKPTAPQNNFLLPTESLTAAQEFFVGQNLDPKQPTLFLQAFTSSAHKNWALEKFFALAGHFRAAGTQVIFACGPREAELLQPARKAGYVIAAGLPMLTVAGVMKLSTVVVGGVTGMTHIAVALQKRVVMLVGWPKDEAALPYQHPDWIVEPPNGVGLDKIEIEPVIAACETAFCDSGGQSPV